MDRWIPSSSPARPHCAAFTLLEVMFGILILGVGFIMLAAMFPVAIEQARSGQDTIVAADIARSAANTIRDRLQGASLDSVPFTNNVITYAENLVMLTDAAHGLGESVVNSADPRYSWTALYRRGGTPEAPDPYIQVFIFVVTHRSGGQKPNGGAAQLRLFPCPVEVAAADVDDCLQIRDDSTTPIAARDAVVPGSFVLTQDGDVMRIGRRRARLAQQDQWELYPGQPGASAVVEDATKAWVVGRLPLPGAVESFDTEDVAVYVTYVKVT